MRDDRNSYIPSNFMKVGTTWLGTDPYLYAIMECQIGKIPESSWGYDL